MKASPGSLVCCSLLIMWAFKIETTNVPEDVCQDEQSFYNLLALSSPGEEYDFVDIDENEKFHCFLYPTNLLNCSWAFPTLPRDADLYVYISICDNNSTVYPLSLISEEHSGSTSILLREYEMLHVIIQFNVSLQQKWSFYSYAYNTEMMEVFPPPGTVSASIKDVDILVTWDMPRGRANYNPSCFEYQLDFGNQEKRPILCCQLFYTIPNVNPASTYGVRVRTRKKFGCFGSQLWSDWSDTVTIQQSSYTFNILVIVAITLGIPMILLTLLLFFRSQRVAQVLYPTIPRPPLKYKYFLEESNLLNFYHPTPSVKLEEIAVVEDTGKQLIKS